MKVQLICTECMKTNPMSITRAIRAEELLESNQYTFTCQNGHQQTVLLQHQKFELLFEVGANAILDGYYREAVTSFASSLERAYEFFTVTCLLERGLSREIVEAYRKKDMKLSERQIGAYITLYTLETGSSPTLLHNDLIHFRNRVVHDGRIPTQAEALRFGQAVLDIIRSLILEIRTRFPKGLDKAIRQHVKLSQKEWGGTLPSTMSTHTIVSLSIVDPDHMTRSLEESLKFILAMRRLTPPGAGG